MIRTVDHQVGLVCAMETCCTECGAVINITLSSDRLDDSTSGNIPFVVVQQAVAASMEMGVGHAGLVRLCRFLRHETSQPQDICEACAAICEANKIVVTRVFDEAAHVVCCVYPALDPSTDDDEAIVLTVSYDGSWMTRGHKFLYGTGCVVHVMHVLSMAAWPLQLSERGSTTMFRSAIATTRGHLVARKFKLQCICGLDH